MDLKLGASHHVRWGELRDEYWDRPDELLSLVESCEELRSTLQATLNVALESHSDWPTELRRWQVVLIAAIELDIASIWDRGIRAETHANLLAKAGEWGVTPTALRMVSDLIGFEWQALRELQVEVPTGWTLQPRNSE